MGSLKKGPPGPTPELRMIIEKNAVELCLAHGNLLSATGGKDVNSLFITSCHAQEGKTVAAVSLACAIAKHARLNILLVDGNLTAPALHKVLGACVSKGLTDVIYNGVPVAECIQESGLENVSLLTCGSGKKESRKKSPKSKKKDADKKKGAAKKKSVGSTALYRSREFASTLKHLRKAFDLIIFDGPPLLTSSDAAWACPQFDGVLLVIACEDTKWEIAEHVLSKIDSVGGTVVGAVLNRRKYYVPSNLYEKY